MLFVASDGVFLKSSSARTAKDHRYVARLDSLLPVALDGRVDPTQVGSLWYGGVLVWLTVPDVPDGESPVIRNVLQVLYSPGWLGAYWGCSHLWDDYDENDPEHLNVSMSGSAPEDSAELAAHWLSEQPRRPLVRREWDPGGYPSAQEWVLTDTGTVIGSRGKISGSRGLVFRRERRAPDRIVPLL